MDRQRQRRGCGGGPGLTLPSGASCQAPTAAPSEGSTQTGAPSLPSPAPWDSGGHPGPGRQQHTQPSWSCSRGPRPQATRREPGRGRCRQLGGPSRQGEGDRKAPALLGSGPCLRPWPSPWAPLGVEETPGQQPSHRRAWQQCPRWPCRVPRRAAAPPARLPVPQQVSS